MYAQLTKTPSGPGQWQSAEQTMRTAGCWCQRREPRECEREREREREREKEREGSVRERERETASGVVVM